MSAGCGLAPSQPLASFPAQVFCGDRPAEPIALPQLALLLQQEAGLLLLLDPLFYAMGFRNATQEPPASKVVVQKSEAGVPSELKCMIAQPVGLSGGQTGCTVISKAWLCRLAKPRTDRRRADLSPTQWCPKPATAGTAPALQIAPASQDGATDP